MLAVFRIEDILEELSVAEHIARLSAILSAKTVYRNPEDVIDIRFAGYGNELTPSGKMASEYADRCEQASKLVDKLAENGLRVIELPSADLDLKELEAFLREAFSLKQAAKLPETPTQQQHSRSGERTRT
ncbi:MAG: hypothetical protein ACYC8W_07780 [Candidatus Tyrphobacter sp.]